MADKQAASKPAVKKGNKAMIIVLVVSMVVGGGLAFVMLQMVLPAPHAALPKVPTQAPAAAQPAPQQEAQQPAPAEQAPAADPAAAAPAADGEAAAAKAAAPAQPTTPMLDLKPFVVTLNEPGSPHYMKITVKAELDSSAAKQEMEIREAEIRDRLILYLSSLTLDKTKGIRAKNQIRSNIVHRANAILEKGQIKRVFISEFITQ